MCGVMKKRISLFCRVVSLRLKRFPTIGIEATPTDPRYLPDQSWYFNRIEAPAAWDIQNLASQVTVAVIDDGILYEHADLEDRMWDNDDETGPGARNDGEDDDNNGYVDDVYGIDVANGDGPRVQQVLYGELRHG